MARSDILDQPIIEEKEDLFDECGIDQDALDELKENMPAKYKMAISICLSETQKFLTQINEGLRSGDAGAVETSAHSIKSSAAMVGMGAVAQQARALEEEAELVKIQGDDVKGLQQRADQLQSAFDLAHPRMAQEAAA